MSDIQPSRDEHPTQRQQGDETVGAPTPSQIENTGLDDGDLDEHGDNTGAFAQAKKDFAGSEVSPAGGVDADIGDGEGDRANIEGVAGTNLPGERVGLANGRSLGVF